MIKLKVHIDETVKDCFNSHMSFQKARDITFIGFMDKFAKTAEFLALYLDSCFKKDFKSVPEEEVDFTLSKMIELFCCLQGRDSFIHTYSDLLAQRLLNRSSVSNQAEEKMINRLAVECGHNVVNKIKVMFEDMEKSKVVINDYKSSQYNILKDFGNLGLDDNKKKDFEFAVEILSYSSWPSFEGSHPTLPPVLKQKQNEFKDFYIQKFKNRELDWKLNIGSIHCKTTYLSKPY